jgi:hypothetical protein
VRDERYAGAVVCAVSAERAAHVYQNELVHDAEEREAMATEQGANADFGLLWQKGLALCNIQLHLLVWFLQYRAQFRGCAGNAVCSVQCHEHILSKVIHLSPVYDVAALGESIGCPWFSQPSGPRCMRMRHPSIII